MKELQHQPSRFSSGGAGDPLKQHIARFTESLRAQGYARTTVEYRSRLVGAVDQWLRRHRIRVSDFNEQVGQRFLEYRWTLRSIQLHDSPTLRHFLQYLRQEKIVPKLIVKPSNNPLHHLQAQFKDYLVRQRGLAQETVNHYVSTAGMFLSKRFGKHIPDLAMLTARDVALFVLERAETVSPSTAQQTTIALRSFLRFLQQRGDLTANLATSVPALSNRSLAGLPKHLPVHEVECLLKASEGKTPRALRDHAMLLLLARLGLRAGEVVHLTLDDVDWETGEVTVRGKGGRQARLPIPKDVGLALCRYLRLGRPGCASRRLFIRLYAPYEGYSHSSSIDDVVRKALHRAGLNPGRRGAHLLRHSLATRMIRRGASLTEIGRILRHEKPQTTAIYAKVDIEGLRALVQPWPGGEL